MRQQNNTHGTMLKHVSKCPCCVCKLSMDICNEVEPEQIASGAQYSWKQSELNLCMPAGIVLAGITLQRLKEFIE